MQKNRYLLISIAVILMLSSLCIYLWINEVNIYVYSSLIAGILLLIYYIYYDKKYLKESVTHRSTKYGINAIIYIFSVIGIILSLNFISYKNYKLYDLSHNKKFTPSSQTIKILKNLKNKVKIIFFITDINKNRSKFDKMKKISISYSNFSKNIEFQFIDHHENPELASEYNIISNGTTIIKCNNKLEKITFISDETLINSIIRVTKKYKKNIFFVTGHGEGKINDNSQFGFLTATNALRNLNYNVEPIVISPPNPINKSCEVLIICSPKKKYSKEEISVIDTFLNSGGSVFIMLGTFPQTNLIDLTKKYGMFAGNDIIIDPQNYKRDIKVPVIRMIPDHEITKELANSYATFPLARSIGGLAGHRCESYLIPLTITSPKSWAETDLMSNKKPVYDPKKDKKGPIVTGIINENPSLTNKNAKLVVLGDEDFARNDYFKNDGNSDLFLNIINYLSKENDLISIKAHDADPIILTMTKKEINMSFYIIVMILPLFTMSIGAIIYFIRKN